MPDPDDEFGRWVPDPQNPGQLKVVTAEEDDAKMAAYYRASLEAQGIDPSMIPVLQAAERRGKAKRRAPKAPTYGNPDTGVYGGRR